MGIREADSRRHIASVLAAALAVAISVWLSGASLYIQGWKQQQAERIALFAPVALLFWALAVCVGLAAAILLVNHYQGKSLAGPAYVTRPLQALWVWTIPFLPWIPDVFPVLLVLAGPLRWVVAGAAVLAVAVRCLRHTSLLGGWRQPGRAAVVVVSFVLYAAFGLRSYALAGLAGDEPHYLIITQSLLRDGDLQIQNNHRRRDYREFYPGELRPDSIRRGANGEIYPNKAPGLPAVLAPAYLAAGPHGAIVALAFIAALAALAIFDVALLIGGRGVAWTVWAGTCLTVPLVPHAWSIYPDVVAAGVAAWTVRWLLMPAPDAIWRWMGRGACLVLLPWLHTRLAVLFAALTVCLLVRFRSHLRYCIALLVPVVLGLVAWFVFFHVIYATFDPRVVWGGATSSQIRLGNVPRGLVGLLFDQKFGLLVYAPVYALVVTGVVSLMRASAMRSTAAMLIATIVAYAMNCTQIYTWWGGSSAPGRFLVPVVPLLAPFVAAGLRDLTTVFGRAIVYSTLGLSLIIAAAGVVEPDRRLLFSPPHGTSALIRLIEGAAPLTSALPIFTETVWLPAVGTLLRWLGAALVSLVAIRLIARRRSVSVFSTSLVLGLTFLVAASALVGRIPREDRAESVVSSRLALLGAFDPAARTAFDYVHLAGLAPQDWLQKSTIVLERQPPVRADGLISPAMPLPPGRYEAMVWFNSGRTAGDLQVTLGRGQILARTDGPLTNPARLTFELPVRVRALWIQMSEPSSSQDVMRVQLTPLSVVAPAERPPMHVRAVESVKGHVGSYVVYVDDRTFPESGGTFWTRELSPGTVMLRPAGARQLVLSLNTGPLAQNVHVQVGASERDVSMRASEAQSLAFDLPAGADWVPIEVKASAAFRPTDVDPQSFDNRRLGCQVRIELR